MIPNASSSPSAPASDSNPLRLLHRIPRLLFHVVMCLLQLAGTAAVRRARGRAFTTKERATMLGRWCGRALRATGTLATVSGPLPQGGVLVSNHLSYVDIFLLSAATPLVFVSKQEVRSYPLIGASGALTGTIFLDRARSVAAQDVTGAMDETLLGGDCIAFFPEGTTTGGGQLLRFRAALFAAPIRLGLPVHTAAIRYGVRGGGDAAELVSFWKDHAMVPHLLRLLMQRGVDAELRFGASFVPAAGKQPAASRAAANHARELVRGLLVEMGAVERDAAD